MVSAPLPVNETERLAKLHSYGILDTMEESEYDDIAALVSEICGTPMANITFVDQNRQWFKASVGLGIRETERDVSFCAHAILGDSLFTVADASADERFHDNPLVTQEPGIRFYAGMPLRTQEGLGVGALCAIDSKPKELTELQRRSLAVLANQVVALLELRLKNRELTRLSDLKTRLLAILAHDLRSPVATISSGLSLLEDHTITEEERRMVTSEVRGVITRTTELVDDLISWATGQMNGAMVDRDEAVDFSSLSARMKTTHTPEAERKGISLDIELSELPIVSSNTAILQFVLRNLITNAIKFTSEGAVRIFGSSTPTHVQIDVSDTGVGMTQADLDSLFDWSRRVRREGTEGEKGSGIALLLCHDMVEHIHATLGVESRPGVGTTFSLIVPRDP